jgi:hypothetical protein
MITTTTTTKMEVVLEKGKNKQNNKEINITII